MITPLHSRTDWNEKPPFEPDGRRLRITAYFPNLAKLTEEDRYRLGVLRDLQQFDCLRITGTDNSWPWRFEVNTTPNSAGCGEIVFIGPEDLAWRFHALHTYDDLDRAIRFIGIGGPTDSRSCALALRLPLVDAHEQSHRDLFITSHDEFLNLRHKLRHANVCDLREGLKLIGLYLRSRDNFDLGARVRFDRLAFYWILCREQLPAMWKYFAACVARGHAAKDNTEYLGNTILDRSVRVIQARDEIGFRFYRRQNNSTREEMLYHFDFLTVMLSGAFDAEARIAKRVYALHKFQRSTISFRNRDFRKSLNSGVSMIRSRGRFNYAA